MKSNTALTIALAVAFGVALPSAAQAITISDEIGYIDSNSYQLTEDNKRLVNTYLRMFRYYTKRNFSATRTVRVLLSNYPEHVEPILHAAFERYPKSYEQIIKAAIDAEPGFTKDIMAVAMHTQVAKPAELVRIAVEAEPAYADEIVVEASRVDPANVEELVRVAVKVEPEMADSIMQSASASQPDKVEGIVHATLSVLPAIGDYLASSLSDLIDLIASDDAEPSANEVTSRKEALSVLKGAYRAGMSYQEIEAIANAHGIDEEEIATVMESKDSGS
ncbi:hypothetical protein [Pseudidiomarina sp. CB1]|uniref:hypothetical protein n=1 Tax=Pseudidiomarina sp. CB1 TaxID=2972484 RepID=UPI002163D8C2|nr:hypothetical protein [Pseudidiomarina sp. CB1]